VPWEDVTLPAMLPSFMFVITGAKTQNTHVGHIADTMSNMLMQT
jgi:hypothetical protein